MFTLWEMKQNSCFRTCYKTPFYIKNLFLIGVLAVCLVVIDFVYFRTENGSIDGVIKMLRGLSSSTFNYLEQQKKHLDADYYESFDVDSSLHMDTLHFSHDCLSKSKVCHFKGIAKNWPAYTKWYPDHKSEEYFTQTFGEEKLPVYQGKKLKSP